MCDKNISLRVLNNLNTSKNYHHWLNDKNTNKFIESRFITHTKKSVENFINICNDAKNIALKGIFIDDIHIGNIKIDINPHHKYATLGILIGDSKYHNMGYGKKSIHLMLDIAKKKSLNKIFVGIYANNTLSINLFKSLKFTQSGLFKRHYLFDNKYQDKILMEYLL